MNHIVDCQNCGVTVLPNNNICPSCNRSILLTSADGMIPVNIYQKHRDKMPYVCMICGGNTDEVTDFTKSRYDGNGMPFWVFLLKSPMQALLQYNINRSKVTVTLPIHRNCYIDSKLIPESVHFDNFHMRFRVSKKFYDEYKKLSL